MTRQFAGGRVVLGQDRGSTDLGWLESKHSFSFGDYRDPGRMNYSVLRVLNDDVVAAGAGFGEHGHRDMEIISIVLEGSLAHRDSAGHRETLLRGDVQVMSAGSGIRHSEMNASKDEPVHFLQVWIEPDHAGHPPHHETLTASDRISGEWIEIASGEPGRGGLRINQDASISVIELDEGSTATVTIPEGRLGYVHIATGAAKLDGSGLIAGDAIELDAGASISLESTEATMLVRFDLPPA